MSTKFKIGDWVAHQATVAKKDEADRDEQLRKPPQLDIRATERVAYVGRVKKITITEAGEVYFVAFAPDSDWKQFGPAELEDAAIMINPPRSAPTGGPTDQYD